MSGKPAPLQMGKYVTHMIRRRVMKKVLAVIVSLAVALTLAAPAFAEPAETTSQDIGLKQDISELNASSFASNNSDSSRPGDEGHIYVGYAITDGVLDAVNSNWAADQVQDIVLAHETEGEGFTAIRAWGSGSRINVAGTLILKDDADGTYASDFTGTGAGITAADGAWVNVSDMTYQSEGFARSFANVENGTLVISNSAITALGADPLQDAYDGYYNSAKTSMMLSPPWILGIQGGSRAVSVLGRKTPSVFVAMDSSISAGGWAAVSTDGCTTPQLYFYDTELNILPLTEGGSYSGSQILGYEDDLYGSGCGTYYLGDASERFYGTTINGATYGAILSGGHGLYEGLKGGQTYTAADIDGSTVVEYEAGSDAPTIVNTVWGIMSDGSGSIDFNEGSVWNSAEGTVLCKEADSVWNFRGAELHPGNGIIFQMMDNDDSTVGGADPCETYLTEDAGFKRDGYEKTVSYVFTRDEEVNPDKTYYETGADEKGGYTVVKEPTREGLPTYYEKDNGGGKVEVNFAGGDYEGCVYNATGYYEQAADALSVTIAEDASLTGDISLTSHVHGIFLEDRDVEDVIAAIEEANAYHESIGGYYKDLEDMEYVLLDADGYVTEDKKEAAAVQFTRFSIAEYYLLGHVINKTNYNGLASLDVTVEGTWTPTAESLLTFLDIKDGAHVLGKITELEDGSILVTPSKDELEPGQYGDAHQFTEALSPEGDPDESSLIVEEPAAGVPEEATAPAAD